MLPNSYLATSVRRIERRPFHLRTCGPWFKSPTMRTTATVRRMWSLHHFHPDTVRGRPTLAFRANQQNRQVLHCKLIDYYYNNYWWFYYFLYLYIIYIDIIYVFNKYYINTKPIYIIKYCFAILPFDTHSDRERNPATFRMSIGSADQNAVLKSNKRGNSVEFQILL